MSMLFNESILSKTVFIVFNDLTSPSPPNHVKSLILTMAVHKPP